MEETETFFFLSFRSNSWFALSSRQNSEVMGERVYNIFSNVWSGHLGVPLFFPFLSFQFLVCTFVTSKFRSYGRTSIQHF